MPTYVSREEIYTRPMREENSCQSPKSALSAKEAVTIKIPENEKIHGHHTTTYFAFLLRLDHFVVSGRAKMCVTVFYSLSLPRFILHIKTGNVESYKGPVLRKCELSNR